jgi:poly(3-hydroxybutyrate) depolymerase
MNVAAEKHQFIVIYPQGLKQDWNVGFGMAYQKGIDDVGFTKALLEHMVNDYRVDQEAVYATVCAGEGFFAIAWRRNYLINSQLLRRLEGLDPIPSPIFIETR